MKTKIENRKSTTTSDDILGKIAVDPEGDILGIIMKLHIDKIKKQMIGFTIDQGFMKPDLYFGINHVRSFGVDSVFLEKIPGEKYKGLEVISHDGGSEGKVIEIEKNKGKLSALIIRKSILSGKRFKVEMKFVKNIGVSVILKKGAIINELEQKKKNVDEF